MPKSFHAGTMSIVKTEEDKVKDDGLFCLIGKPVCHYCVETQSLLSNCETWAEFIKQAKDKAIKNVYKEKIENQPCLAL